MLNVSPEVISEVANAIDGREDGIQIDWINKAIGEIITKKEHYIGTRN